MAELEQVEGAVGQAPTEAQEWTQTESVKRAFLPEPERAPSVGPADPMVRVVVAVPMERTIQQEAFFGFVRLFRQGWSMAQLPYCRNDIAREWFGRFLRDTKNEDGTPRYTHMLMLDSDHVHPEDIVQRLARWVWLYPNTVKVVGGLNFRRGEPYDPCAFINPGDGKFHRLADWGHGLLEVEALGTGSMLIAREVFEQIPEPWFEYQYPGGDFTPGTDMSFSSKCREAGIKLWVDGSTTSPHLGVREIGQDEYREYVARQQGKTVLVTPEDASMAAEVRRQIAEQMEAKGSDSSSDGDSAPDDTRGD